MMFEKVSDYTEGTPKGKFGFAGIRWGFILIADFLFGFSHRKKDQGKIIKKLENPTFIGGAFRSSHKRCISKLLKENEAFSNTLSIPTIQAHDFNQDFFANWRKHVNMPIIIKGFLNDAPIKQELSKEELTQKKGDIKVRFIEFHKNNENRVGQNVASQETTLKNFLNKPEFENCYINNFYGIVDDNDFIEKCKGDKIDAIQGQPNILNQWFISRSNTVGSSLHCAGGENMFLNIVGQKQWDFIHPSYSSILQTSVSQYGTYAVSEMQENFIEDPRKELISNYPHMQNVPFYRCVLEEGDMLYNPDLWWHTVRNLTDFNIGCATRYWSTSNKVNTVSLAMILDILKNPRKSSIIQARKILKGKQPKSSFNKIIFTNSEKKQVKEI